MWEKFWLNPCQREAYKKMMNSLIFKEIKNVQLLQLQQLNYAKKIN